MNYEFKQLKKCNSEELKTVKANHRFKQFNATQKAERITG